MASRVTICIKKTAYNLPLYRQAQTLILRPMTSQSQPTVSANIKMKQEAFELDDGVPVYIKGGALDNIMYRFTMGCCILSLIMIGKNFYNMVVSKKGK